jgi:LmbE family N-acetylglucosaminyl deacetylase
MLKLTSGPILVVCAHPDDAELMAGGIISRAVSNGVEVYSVIISDGCENGEIKIRQKEAHKAARILGIKEIYFCGIKDGRIPHNIEMVNKVEKYLRDIDPSIVITHSDQDTHQDHKNVCNITLSATRRKPEIVLLGETPSTFLNDNLLYFDITDTLENKVKALKAYYSQIKEGPVNIQNIKTLASFRGQRAGTKYAEAFKNWRMVL